MQMTVDQDLCISCGACVDTCPEVFEWNNDEKASVTVEEVPPNVEDQALEAMDSCPTEAITKE